MIIDVPDADAFAWRDITLKTEEREVKGEEAEADEIDGWISLGDPICRPITKSTVGDDKELAALLHAERDVARYYLVHLGCSFRPPEGQVFESAALRVQMSRADQAPNTKPVAWSLMPDNLFDEQKLPVKLKFTADLKLVKAEVEPDLPARKTPYLQAFNELQANPRWEFTRTSVTSIQGMYRLTLVVRAPVEAESKGVVQLMAKVRGYKLGGILIYVSAFPDSPETAFTLA